MTWSVLYRTLQSTLIFVPHCVNVSAKNTLKFYWFRCLWLPRNNSKTIREHFSVMANYPILRTSLKPGTETIYRFIGPRRCSPFLRQVLVGSLLLANIFAWHTMSRISFDTAHTKICTIVQSFIHRAEALPCTSLLHINLMGEEQPKTKTTVNVTNLFPCHRQKHLSRSVRPLECSP